MLTKSSDTLQYLIDAVSGPVKINIPAIAAGHFQKDNIQAAVYFKGKSSVVFAFQLQKKLKAVKIWPAPLNQSLRNHYHIIENYLQRGELNYFGGICYLKDAITIKDQQHDALLMDWIARQNVKEYIIANIDQKQLIDSLAEKIYRLHYDLNNAGIAHGHLHTGNIYIDANNALKLIDYDSLYVKGITEEQELEQNYPDYCHPSFGTHQKINARSDYFSALLLYLGTKAIANNPVLWGRYKVGFHDNFLFTAADFSDLKNSSVYKYLRKNNSPEIDELLDILLMYCEEKYPGNLQPFYTYLKNNVQPVAKPVVVIENTEAGKPSADSTPPVKTSSLIYITMPAPTATIKKEKPQIINEEKPQEKNNDTQNILTPVPKSEELSPEPVLLTSNSKQAIVIDLAAHLQDLRASQMEDNIEDNIVVTEETLIHNTARPGATKRQKKLFLAAASFAAVAIFTTLYFLGNYTGNTNKIISPGVTKKTQQEATPLQKADPISSQDTNTITLPVTAAETNKKIRAESNSSTAASDSVATVPDAAAVSAAKTTIKTDQPTHTSLNNPGTQLSENTPYKPAVVKNSTSKKQPSNSFEIGSVPKQ